MQRVTQYRHDVLRTKCEEQANGNSPLEFLPAEFGICFGKAAIIRPRAPPPGRQTSLGGETFGVGSSAATAAAPPEGADPRAGATPPEGEPKTK